MRYWLFITLLMASAGTLAAQPDKAEVRRGNRAFGKGNFFPATLEYRKALEKDSTSVPAHYNLSNARYRLEEYEQAEMGLKERVKTIEHPVQRADAYHNLGNAQLMQKKYAESIDSYKDALRLRPNDMETKSNLAYAQKMLENQENQDEDQDQDQDQDEDQQDQDQNQDQNQDQKQKEQEVPPKITPQDARQMLEAMQQKEKETQEKVNREKIQVVRPPGKNW